MLIWSPNYKSVKTEDVHLNLIVRFGEICTGSTLSKRTIVSLVIPGTLLEWFIYAAGRAHQLELLCIPFLCKSTGLVRVVGRVPFIEINSLHAAYWVQYMPSENLKTALPECFRLVISTAGPIKAILSRKKTQCGLCSSKGNLILHFQSLVRRGPYVSCLGGRIGLGN